MQSLVFVVAIVGLILVGFLGYRAFKPHPAGGPMDKVPAALRPGDTDDVLESDRLYRIQRWGFALSLIFAMAIFFYWLNEPVRMRAKEVTFRAQSVARGKYYFSLAEDPVTGKPPEKGVGRATGQPVQCARCHGVGAKGGTNVFLDPLTGANRTVQVPELQTVFARYEKPPGGFKDARAFITETVQRGRPGTDMPTWGNAYGGPLTDPQISDIVDYLATIQRPIPAAAANDGPTIFATFCSPCHGIGGSGGSGPSMTGGSETREFPNIDDQVAFVKAGSKPGVPYGTHGKGTGGMPTWGGRLTDDQIKAVIAYERSR